MTETPRLRWFEVFSACRMCAKPSQGILRGLENESYGPHCRKCAEMRLARSKTERERIERNEKTNA
jgi:hypothetical protein